MEKDHVQNRHEFAVKSNTMTNNDEQFLGELIYSGCLVTRVFILPLYGAEPGHGKHYIL